MKRTSPYFDLKYRVDAMQPPHPATWWQTIAAFDHDQVAIDYGKRCMANQTIKGFKYRVMERAARGWRRIWGDDS